MKSRGFTIVEVLGVLVILSLITIIILKEMNSTFSVSKEEAYKLMKQNIISSSYDYIKECEAGLITCNFSFDNNPTFYASALKANGYYKSLESPLDGKDVGSCLLLKAKKANGVIQIDLIDKCYD